MKRRLLLLLAATSLAACVGQRPEPPSTPTSARGSTTATPAPAPGTPSAEQHPAGRWRGRKLLFVPPDLALGPVPFVAGELLHGGCCAGHNTLVNQLPHGVTGPFVVSAEGLAGMDRAHFDLSGQRELGRRYAEKMLAALAK